MRKLYISDVTMKQVGDASGFSLSFKEKIELAKLLDRLGVSVIETDGIRRPKIDSLLIKSIAPAVKNSVVAVPVELDGGNIDETWAALREAKSPRLQVPAPMSAVQMEYLSRMKPEELLKKMEETIRACKKLCEDVEFIADDASRSEPAFLKRALETAIKAGADIVTICDTAGTMLPYEFEAFLRDLLADVAGIDGVRVGVSCANNLAMADSCAVAAVRCGVQEIKAAVRDVNTVSLENIARLISEKGYIYNVTTDIRITELQRVIQQIHWICNTVRSKGSPFDFGVQEVEDDFMALSAHESRASVAMVVKRLGYELSDEDEARVYDEFTRIAARKKSIGRKELDAIVAAAAMQVPPTYQVESYVINTGNIITATAHLKLKKNEEILGGISIGDGPIDASFLAIENIVGCHYELDDFQIQSVTQGRQAMAEAVVKLRSNGKVYSGHGISTDIIGASIRAYVNALNKIVYEEVGV